MQELVCELHRAPDGHFEQKPLQLVSPASHLQEPSAWRVLLAGQGAPCTHAWLKKQQPELHTQVPSPLSNELAGQTTGTIKPVSFDPLPPLPFDPLAPLPFDPLPEFDPPVPSRGLSLSGTIIGLQATERAVHQPLMQPKPTSQAHSFPLKKAFLGQVELELLLAEADEGDEEEEEEEEEAEEAVTEGAAGTEGAVTEGVLELDEEELELDELDEPDELEVVDDDDVVVVVEPELELEDELEDEAGRAVPTQATPPSLQVTAVVPRGHELKQVFPQARLADPQPEQSLLGEFPAAMQTIPSESKFLEEESVSWKLLEMWQLQASGSQPLRETWVRPYSRQEFWQRLLLTSLLNEPTKALRPTDPPYALKEAVTGEKAIQLSQIPAILVEGPNKILTERVVPCRLEGLTAIWTTLESAWYPLRKALMTGLSLGPKADLMVVVAMAELAVIARLVELKYPSWI